MTEPVPRPATVYAYDPTRVTNADLIFDAWRLGHIVVPLLDPTYGMGRWWGGAMQEVVERLEAQWREYAEGEAAAMGVAAGPAFTFTDLYTTTPYPRPIDFTDLPWRAHTFNTVAFDPPYKLNGRGGSVSEDEGYGVADNLSATERHLLIFAGIEECMRVLSLGGHLLLKCQDQVSSGRVHWQTRMFTEHAERFGGKLIDRLYLRNTREQPAGRRQVHARNNYSTLLVIRKGK